MNARIVSIVLLVVTLALLATVGYVAWRLQSDPDTRFIRTTKVVTNTVTQIAVRKINATNLFAALASRPLNWAALESTNYQIYIANLRAFGCPEETVRDIILTDISKAYARRRAALREQFQPYQYWRTDDENAYSANPELQRQLHELDKEQRTLVRELLGVEYRAEMTKYWEDSEYEQQAYAYLPEAKREQLRALQEKYADLEQEIYLRTRGMLLEEDQRALRKLSQQRETELASVLTSEELEEYQLRNSDSAQALRARFSGFAITEEEFRKLFELQKTFDEQFGNAFDPGDEAAMALKADAESDALRTLEEEMRDMLGPERSAELDRAQDETYKTLLQFADRFELSNETVRRVYEAKVAAERQKEALESKPNITDEQRAAALAAIARETEKEATRIMGEKVFKVYRKAAGEWINDLAIVPPRPVEENVGQ